MNDFLFKMFIKDYDNVNSPAVRERYGKFAGIVGILSNLVLSVGKIIAGIISGSISVIADSINNLTDASSSLITFIGFKMASIPEDKNHPYGHARFEYISGIVVAMLVEIAGIELIQSSIKKIFNPEPVIISGLVIGILVASIIVKLWQTTFNLSIGKKINSAAIIATGTDSRNDVISTTAVLIGLLITWKTGLHLDGYIGAGVAIFIIVSGIGLLKDTISPLLGEAPDHELVKKIQEIALSYDKVLGIHDLIIHNYGPGKIFASVHVEVDADNNLFDIHEMIDTMEREISKELNLTITAHVDPVEVNNPEVKSIFTIMNEAAEAINGISHLHDMQVVASTEFTNISFDVVVTSECTMTEKELLGYFQNTANTINRNYIVTIKFDKSYIDLD